MGRIWINEQWFEQVEPYSLNEDRFELEVKLHSPEIYPDYYVVPFKKAVEGLDLTPSVTPQMKTVIPDLAFIAKDYKSWWVVEVEMTYHSLKGHVLPQVGALKTATYGVEIAEYLARNNPQLDFEQLKTLILRSETQVLVVVNQFIAEWQNELKNLGAVMAVFELFISENQTEVFGVNGEYPHIVIERICDCEFHPTIKTVISIENPDEIGLPARDRIKLRYNNCITEWERRDAAGKTWLIPVGRSFIATTHNYQIFRQSDDTFVLRQKINQRIENML